MNSRIGIDAGKKQMEIKKIDKLVWTPVRTRPRHEKKLKNYCLNHSINCYLPLYKKVKRYVRKTVEHWLPMFPGYLFVCLDDEIYSTLVRSGAVIYRINMNEVSEKRLINDLQALVKFEKIAAGREIVIKPDIVEGKKVMVTEGPFKGMSGIIEKRKNKFAVTVDIEILGQSVSAEMDIEDVEIDEF
jgi:transcription antitermination factor NusG